jgi:hypothetical protein
MLIPPLPVRKVERVLNTSLVSDSSVVIRAKMLTYFRVRSDTRLLNRITPCSQTQFKRLKPFLQTFFILKILCDFAALLEAFLLI